MATKFTDYKDMWLCFIYIGKYIYTFSPYLKRAGIASSKNRCYFVKQITSVYVGICVYGTSGLKWESVQLQYNDVICVASVAHLIAHCPV